MATMNTIPQNTTPEKLTAEQKISGQKKYLWFTRINSISFGCLAESTLILYAIKNGADDFLIGMITSFAFLTMPMMFLGKGMIKRMGAAKTYGISWILRNSSALLLIFVPAAIARFSAEMGLVLLCLGALGFYGFRSMGITANTPLIGEITDSKNRGNYISKIWLHFNIFYMVAMVALVYILGHSDKIIVFQGIIIFGVVCGLLSSGVVFRIPESINPKKSAHNHIAESLRYLMENVRLRKMLFAWSSVSLAMMLINPFSMVAVKNGYLVSDRLAIIFALLQVTGAMFASYLNGFTLDRFGPRPVLILFSLGFFVTCLLWIVAPASFHMLYVAVIFLLIGIVNAGANSSLSHYFLSIIPKKERVGVNIFVYIISGVIAGLGGTFLGGGLLKLLRLFQLTDLNIYRTYFIIIAFVIVPLLNVIRKLERLEDWRIKDVLGILMSLRDIRSLFSIRPKN